MNKEPTISTLKNLDRDLKKLKKRTLLTKGAYGKCLAQVRIYIGQGVMGGTWVQCSKNKRPGYKTCCFHKNLE